MADVQHAALRPGQDSGIHVAHAWEVLSQSARETLPVTPHDVGKICRQAEGADDASFWVLTNGAAGAVRWRRLDNPEGIQLSNAAPKPLGMPTPGDDAEPARGDHVHPHGNLAGGTLHAIATTETPGFMSAAQVARLAALPASFDAFATDAEVTAAVAPKADRAFVVKWIEEDYTLTLADAGALLVGDKGTGEGGLPIDGQIRVTIPSDSSVPFPIGTVITLVGVSRCNFQPADYYDDEENRVMNFRSTLWWNTRESHSVISAIKLAPNDWLITGDVGYIP